MAVDLTLRTRVKVLRLSETVGLYQTWRSGCFEGHHHRTPMQSLKGHKWSHQRPCHPVPASETGTGWAPGHPKSPFWPKPSRDLAQILSSIHLVFGLSHKLGFNHHAECRHEQQFEELGRPADKTLVRRVWRGDLADQLQQQMKSSWLPAELSLLFPWVRSYASCGAFIWFLVVEFMSCSDSAASFPRLPVIENTSRLISWT